MDPSYIAGVFDGDGSVNVSLVGPPGKKGYLLKVELTQCDAAYLRRVNDALGGNGKIYTDARDDKYLHESASTLRFCGAKGRPVYDIMCRHAIIKAPQARLALTMLDLPRVGTGDAKEVIRCRMSALNADKSYEKEYEKMTDAYVSGLFDAEGDARSSSADGRVRRRVRITQKSDPIIAAKICDHFGYGSVRDGFRFVIESKQHIADFIQRIAPFATYPRRAAQIDALTRTML